MAAPAAFPVLIAAFIAAIFTPAASAATINVTAYASGASSFSDDEAILDAAIANDGNFQTADTTVTVDDILEPRGLFSGATVIREDGETDAIRLSNLILQFFSDDANASFNGNNVLFDSVDYNGTTARGFLAGPDEELFTSDDVEVGVDTGDFSGTQDVDYFGVAGYGVNFANTASNRMYFEGEVDFTVRSQFSLDGDFDFPIGGNSFTSTVTNAVPEPASMLLVAIGLPALMRRNR